MILILKLSIFYLLKYYIIIETFFKYKLYILNIIQIKSLTTKKRNNFGTSTIFFILIMKKMSLYTDMTKKNIRYNKLLSDIRYKKILKSILKKFDSNK